MAVRVGEFRNLASLCVLLQYFRCRFTGTRSARTCSQSVSCALAFDDRAWSIKGFYSDFFSGHSWERSHCGIYHTVSLF